MTDSLTLEAYRFGSTEAVEAAAEPRPARLWSRRVFSDIIGVTEFAAVVIGGLLPSAVYAYSGSLTPDWRGVVQSALLAALIFRIYQPFDPAELDRDRHLTVRAGRTVTALSIAIFAALMLGAPAGLGAYTLLAWFALWVSASYAGVVVVRTLANDFMLARAAEGRFDERIAVYGAGGIARKLYESLGDPSRGMRFVGVYESRGLSDRVDLEGMPLAGNLDDLVEACRLGRIDRIVIALPQVAERRIRDIASRFEDLSVELQIVTHVSTDFVGEARANRVSRIGPVGLMDLKVRRHAAWAPISKRCADLVLGTLIAVCVAPVVPLIAIAIKLDSDGPVLFRQKRAGRNKRVFQVLKFRTMTVEEQGRDVVQATTHDPRITRVGAFLRRTSLDELPQLWNVLWGDMSLVGPRPHALVHDERWGALIETYANRHQMKPGVTGLAQVHGFRGETNRPEQIEGRVHYDLAYVRDWSMWLDIKILVMTVRAVLAGTNAK